MRYRIHSLSSVARTVARAASYLSIGLVLSLALGVFASSASADEAQLIQTLQSESAPADKALACKRLAIEGTGAAVPALSALLDNAELASWARIALEAIPDPAADAALRKSLDQLQGNLLLGAINSLGVRRDVDSVAAIAPHLKSETMQVAASAAAALGRIGTDDALAQLRPLLNDSSPDLRSAAAEGCVLCAEQMMQTNRWQDAADLYDQVRQADVNRPRRQEATRGAILARRDAGIPLLLEQLQAADKGMFRLGLTVARELPGDEVTRAIAGLIKQVAADRQGLLVLALADRQDDAVVPTVLDLVQSESIPVQIAALQVLQQRGNADCVPAMLRAAVSTNEELHAAAVQALVGVPGAAVDRSLTEQLAGASGRLRAVLIELAGARRLSAATPMLLKAIDDSDTATRIAALRAAGETVGPQDLQVLVQRVMSSKSTSGEEYDAARQALTAASIRMPDREACAQQLTAALAQAAPQSRRAAIAILGQMGGPTALQTVAAAASDKDADLADDASRLLGEWMTDDAAPVLLSLAGSATEAKLQVRAVRGYLRIARQFVLPDAQRMEMCRAALKVAKRDEERKLILEVLERYPTLDGLKLVAELHKLPSLREAAAQSGVAIAQKLGDSPEVSEALNQLGFQPVKLEIIKAEYGANQTMRDVTKELRKHAGNLPWVVLPSGYNSTFGGDPTPGTAKQLKVQYKINDRPGAATFAENSTIVLPMP